MFNNYLCRSAHAHQMSTRHDSGSFGYPGMERWKGRVAIVTGASAGIGYETAKRLVQLGVVVVGCARNITAIEVRGFSLAWSDTGVYKSMLRLEFINPWSEHIFINSACAY